MQKAYYLQALHLARYKKAPPPPYVRGQNYGECMRGSEVCGIVGHPEPEKKI